MRLIFSDFYSIRKFCEFLLNFTFGCDVRGYILDFGNRDFLHLCNLHFEIYNEERFGEILIRLSDGLNMEI